MWVRQAFHFELDPSREARIALAKHVGAARFAYNGGLARCREAIERGQRIPSAMELHRVWVVEAGSSRSFVSPFGVKSMTMRGGTASEHREARRWRDGSG